MVASGSDTAGRAGGSSDRITLSEVNEILKSSRNLAGKDLTGLQLTGMDLSRCNLKGSNLSKANLERADLGETNLERVDLSSANLRMVNLRLAGMLGTNLQGAVLDGAIWQDGRLCATNSTGECRDPLAPLQAR